MSTSLYTPSLPELFRIDTTSLEAAEQSLESIYLDSGAPFNYLPANKTLQKAFKSLHNPLQLVAGCQNSGHVKGIKPNSEVILLAGPVAFGRVMQVFQPPKRNFKFGKDRYSPFRIPFFFVEGGVVKICFLQPRKSGRLTNEQCGGLFAVIKRHFLDIEFYGVASDVEYIDVSAPDGKKSRELSVLTLKDVELWDEARLTSHLTVVSQAIDNLERSGLATEVKPRRAFRDPELPLLD